MYVFLKVLAIRISDKLDIEAILLMILIETPLTFRVSILSFL